MTTQKPTSLTTDIENLITLLENQQKQGNTINIHPGETTGSSSCTLKKTSKGETTYELKVYSNDLDGANQAVQRAIEVKKTLDALVSNGTNAKED